MQGATLAGLFFGGVLADGLFRWTKASRLWLMVISLACCIPCLYWIGYSESLKATHTSLAAFGLFGGLLIGNIFPAAFEVVPSDPPPRLLDCSISSVRSFCRICTTGRRHLESDHRD